MTNKDFLKMILCLYRYDDDISIETVKADFEGINYEVTAKNSRTGDIYCGFSCGGIMMAIYDFLEYIERLRDGYNTMKPVEIPLYETEEYIEEPPSVSSKWCYYPMKCVFDDKFRKKTIDHCKKVERENKEYQEFFKEVDKQIQDSMPCRNGTCEDRVWTDMPCVDNCEKNYHMNCPKLLEWHEYVKNVRSKRNEEWDKHKEEEAIKNFKNEDEKK